MAVQSNEIKADKDRIPSSKLANNLGNLMWVTPHEKGVCRAEFQG